jgi:ABC-type Fe3+-siderophore transport system permease subunit
VLILALAGATMVALAYGPFPLTVDDVVRATKRLTGDDLGAITSGEIVFMRVRLPRVAADILVGAALSGGRRHRRTRRRLHFAGDDSRRSL